MKHCSDTLRRLLSPHYAVLNVNSSTLLNEPWSSHTSLLVFPGGADLPYCREFNGKGNQLISQYVQNGGRYIGFCAGGYYASGKVEFEVGNTELEVNGPRELKFFPGIARGSIFEGFQYGSHTCAHAANIIPNNEALNLDDKALPSTFGSYVNGGCLFVDADDYANSGIEVLARYSDELAVNGTDKTNFNLKLPAAAVYCKVGDGCAVLTGIHPEFSPDLLKPIPSNKKYTSLLQKLSDNDDYRILFMRSLLKKMGLRTNDNEVPIPGLTRLSLTSSYPPRLIYLIDVLKKEIGHRGGDILKAHNDTFRLWDARQDVFQAPKPDNTHLSGYHEDGDPELDTTIKDIDVYYTGLPESRLTSSFNHELYYNSLKEFYGKQGSLEELGTIILYGEVVTSTSIMLYKNFDLLRLLPNGFSIVGTIQTAGRGRGNNVWVTPPGVLAVSTVLRMPLHHISGRPSPMVFTQYIVSLAMVEAIRAYGPGYDCVPVRLKWPNDIYCENPEYSSLSPENDSISEFLKIAGLLINSTICEGEYILVAGIGVNVTNNAPSTSLNSILNKLNEGERKKKGLAPLEPYTIEKLLAKYFATLETMLTEFRYQGFVAFENLYYKRWLHR